MKKLFFLIVFLNIAFIIKAQNLHLTIFGGFSNYQGDLQDKRFTLNQAHPAFGIGVLYDITNNLSARANITFGKVSGDDKYNSKNTVRNLNFSSTVTDFHFGVEYSILNIQEHSLAPYVFAGISYFIFNPSTKDSAGNKIYLQPLSTEGQGFYQGRNKYNKNQFSIPFGGGVKFALNENIQLAFEIGMRKTNTDYLDDVSTTYIDQNILFLNRGQQAVDLAFRGDELKAGLIYPADGSQRGSPKNKDWYYFSGLNICFRLNSNNGGVNISKSKSKTGCPTNIY